MLAVILALLLVLVLFGAGFALKALWWVAVVVFVFWLLGFVIRGAHPSGGRRRWYRW
ncbi:hydrophobic protein [Kitasatospora sp. NPDC006697]|uniref:hydrophobic protein n=1 Tax=Kitasatospora sp. NPDC006697 TaxID=3364020 RepID=UPI0036881EB1